MTLAELKTQIKFEAKIENDSNWNTILDQLIHEQMIQLVIAQPELAEIKQITYLGFTAVFDLPATILAVERVEYTSASPSARWEIPHRDKVIGPAYMTGRVNCYEVVKAGAASALLAIRLLPLTATIPGADSLDIWYKNLPTKLTDSDTIRNNAMIPFLQAACLRRIALYHSQPSLEVAKAYVAEVNQSGSAQQSNNAESSR